MSGPHWFETIISWYNSRIAGMQILLVLVLALCFHVIIKIWLGHIRKVHSQSNSVFKAALLIALCKFLTILTWFVVFLYITQLIFDLLHYTPHKFTLIQLNEIGIIISVAWFCLHLISEAQRRHVAIVQEHDKTFVAAGVRFLHMIVVLITLLAILRVCGLSLSAVYAASAGLGFGIGFAAQNLLQNMFSGFVLFMERPFKLGDRISSSSNNFSGIVEDIGWRTTRIRATDSRLVYVPNSNFSTGVFTNDSVSLYYSIEQTIHLRLADADKVAKITAALTQMIQQDPAHLSTYQPTVALVSIDEDGLKLAIKAHMSPSSNFKAVQQALLLKIIAIITENGAQLVNETS